MFTYCIFLGILEEKLGIKPQDVIFGPEVWPGRVELLKNG
jgi:hypothetical protein